MIVRSSPIPQWVADLRALRMLDANEAALSFWRMSREQFLTLDVTRFFHSDERSRWHEFISRDKWGESGPWKCVRGDSSVFYCTIRWQMIDYEGTPSAFVFPVRAGESPSAMADYNASAITAR